MEALKIVAFAVAAADRQSALASTRAAPETRDLPICAVGPAPTAAHLHRLLSSAGAYLAEALLVTDRLETATSAARAGWQVVVLGALPEGLLHELAGPRGPVVIDDAAELPALLQGRVLVGQSGGRHSMAPVTIRRASAADTPVVLWLTRAAFAEHWGRIEPPSGAHTEPLARVRRDVATGAALAEVGGYPVGAVRFAAEGDDAMYLGRLAVLPGWRNRGVARRLIEYVEVAARQYGSSAVRLGTRAALRQNWQFYQRLGYCIVAEEPGANPPLTRMYWLRKELAG